MEYLIAVLLILILIAQVSSSNSSALAIRRVFHYSLIALSLLALLGIELTFGGWILSSKILTGFDFWLTLLGLTLFSAYLNWRIWDSRKSIAKEIETDKLKFIWKVFKWICFLLVIILAINIYEATAEIYTYPLLALGLFVTGVSGFFLFIKSVVTGNWRETWFQFPESAINRATLEVEKLIKNENEQWLKNHENRHTINDDEFKSHQERLDKIWESENELIRKYSKQSIENMSFWIGIVWVVIGLLTIFWDFSIAFLAGINEINHFKYAPMVLTTFAIFIIIGTLATVTQKIIDFLKDY